MINNDKVLIIAEAGVNHNGSIELAMKLIDAAAMAGADIVKFQTFRAKNLVTADAPKADYQKLSSDPRESQFDMLRKLELDERAHKQLIAHSDKRNIAFMSTPFDLESLVFLINDLSQTTIKVSSGDITNAPFLLDIARMAKKVILSTGMSDIEEIEEALGVLSFGFLSPCNKPPSLLAFKQAFKSKTGQQALKNRVALLHCTSEYPAPIADVNLRAINTLYKKFGLLTGYSDHTVGIHVPIAAVALGAKIIEKHFTLDRAMTGPDHNASLEPDELYNMVQSIRDIEVSFGDGNKRPMESELRNRQMVRKSLVSELSVKRSHPLNLQVKRPGGGCSPFLYWDLQGSPATRDYKQDEQIDGL